MKGTLNENLCAFMAISRCILLKLKMLQTEVVAKMKTHILCSVSFFENRAVYEIMSNNPVELQRQCNTAHAHCVMCD